MSSLSLIVLWAFLLFFFFSSRRRHTRSLCDWSSDVCSSDLCLLTHGNLLANARQISEWLGFAEDDRLLTIMPLFHMNAVSVTTLSALHAGGSTVVSPRFSASRDRKSVV